MRHRRRARELELPLQSHLRSDAITRLLRGLSSVFLEHLREAVQARGGDAASLDDETIINIVRDGRQAIGPENVQLAVQMLKQQLV